MLRDWFTEIPPSQGCPNPEGGPTRLSGAAGGGNRWPERGSATGKSPALSRLQNQRNPQTLEVQDP
ncbi:hypothetical protein SHJG_p228 (plasmid) [Streptomyces hygroscopicus subsp. jinggangensis 5008]|nr:hypothetical protein SHJG_p228 [Streptomyces hygroscopicus subsp. jinggangensis 5008]AGF68497.1 hypothetical protein SHJGH_p228 [Streptomyces hygroscopicus subsp. jinggangensis TL01]